MERSQSLEAFIDKEKETRVSLGKERSKHAKSKRQLNIEKSLKSRLEIEQGKVSAAADKKAQDLAATNEELIKKLREENARAFLDLEKS